MVTEMKQRIVGGVVMAAILALFLPVLLHQPKTVNNELNLGAAQKPPVVSEISVQLPAVVPSPIQASTPVSRAPAALNSPGAAAIAATQQRELKESPAAVLPSVSAPQTTPSSQNATVTTPNVTSNTTPAALNTTAVAAPDVSSSTVAVPVNTAILDAAMSTPPAWVVQVASFAQASHAKELVERLQQQGFEAYLRNNHNPSHPITQVFIGPDIRRDKIDALNKKLQQRFHLKGVVRKYSV